MAIKTNTRAWWGPPKKFTGESEERKISWLELFYDLVYVIAISRITHHLAEHLDFTGLLDYTYFFSMIFWGWLNGSLYHDLHGSAGLRTSLMTLWQITIVAALVVTINSAPETLVFNVTVALMAMQLYITYMWWSVGIYDRDHRKVNRPYTFFYLASFGMLLLTFYIDQAYVRPAFYIALLFNFLPPLVGNRELRRSGFELSLSPSMTERLGLFTIIVFGEVVLGIVNGVSALHTLNPEIWMHFGLAILITFSLWWIFFTLVSDRPCIKGFVQSSIMELLYIPTLMALGMIAVDFNGIFESFARQDEASNWIKSTFGLSIGVFLVGVFLLLYFLEYPTRFEGLKKQIQYTLLSGGLAFFALTAIDMQVSLGIYLSVTLGILLSVIGALNWMYYVERQKIYP